MAVLNWNATTNEWESEGFGIGSAAPASGAMNPGDIALWYDDTNGAAKLNIKAKTANGTVVTGQIALA